MKYISLATHNNELIIITGMDAFTAHFCYSKKQRQGKIDIPAPAIINTDDSEIPVPRLEIEEVEIADEDDL
jgi:hypothetical protein